MRSHVSRLNRPLMAALAAALVTVPLLAAPVRINLATLAPASTTVAQSAARHGQHVEDDDRGPRHGDRVRGRQPRRGNDHHQDAPGLRDRPGGVPHRHGSRPDRPELQRLLDSVLLRIGRRGAGRRDQAHAAHRAEAQRQGLSLPRVGHRRLGPGLLEEAAAHARRCQGGKALHEQGVRQLAGVVRQERIQSGGAACPPISPSS